MRISKEGIGDFGSLGKCPILVDPKRIESIKKMKVPTTRKEMESFLGTINYCSKFIKNVTEETEYLYSIVKKTSEFDLTKSVKDERLVGAGNQLKRRLGDVHTLAVPRGDGKFILTTDASDLGIGAIFSQEQFGKERILNYY